ncbi:MAG: hypothetical protein Q8N40_21155 [Bradyrhizobium sp.]|nr:hypothetical protein [Bradyrhizobium sp.]MDP3078138.1 hypothetical protein [Bradyrhizobium sp.]
MSEQQAEPTSSETGSVSAGPAVSSSTDAASQPAAAQETPLAATRIESPDLVPAQGDAAKVEAPKVEAPKLETPKVDAPKVEAADTAKSDAPRAPGKIMIMSSGDRAWDHQGVEPEAEAEQAQGMFGKRRLSALAAVVALAAVAGALGGALATAGVMQFAGGTSATSSNLVLEASVARIDADILALKAGVEQTSKVGIVRDNKASDRLDRIEKAQAEPAAKLARLTEAVEKLKAAQAAPVPVAAVPAAAKDITGSISPPATAVAAPVPLPVPKPEVARLPTVEGWVLREVAHGGALIEGRQGIYEVYAGDPVPGLGRVDAIRKQDGRWVVVTSKGLVVAR